jgi:hypothetical protein
MDEFYVLYKTSFFSYVLYKTKNSLFHDNHLDSTFRDKKKKTSSQKANPAGIRASFRIAKLCFY